MHYSKGMIFSFPNWIDNDSNIARKSRQQKKDYYVDLTLFFGKFLVQTGENSNISNARQ